jgi:hypothetical protein
MFGLPLFAITLFLSRDVLVFLAFDADLAATFFVGVLRADIFEIGFFFEAFLDVFLDAFLDFFAMRITRTARR